MQLEMARLTCPLCKRQLPANSPEHVLSTRLCDQCQTMVLTAFRGPNSILAASTAVVPQNRLSARVQHDVPAPDYAMVGAPVLFCGNQADAAFEHESQSAASNEIPDAVRFDLYQDQDPIDRVSTPDEDSTPFSKNGSSRDREELFEGFVQSIGTVDHDYAETDDLPPIGQASEFTEAALDSNTEASVVDDRREDPPSIGEEAATDPWEVPLPPWDYSQNEWPVLVGPSMQRSLRAVRYGIAAVVLLACAAGFYFLIYHPSNPKLVTVAAFQSSAAAAGSADSELAARAAPATSGIPAGAASRPAEAAATEAVAADDASAKGRFSLQAAAFPTQAGADEFAERLKRAGVPSYVVPADIARRGRWFRVRVGRFNSAEDAQRFAGEAQQRARATGLALQLIVCQYGEP